MNQPNKEKSINMKKIIYNYFDSWGTLEIPAERLWIFPLILFPIAFPLFALKQWIFNK
jgi:hypothetical protein